MQILQCVLYGQLLIALLVFNCGHKKEAKPQGEANQSAADEQNDKTNKDSPAGAESGTNDELTEDLPSVNPQTICNGSSANQLVDCLVADFKKLEPALGKLIAKENSPVIGFIKNTLIELDKLNLDQKLSETDRKSFSNIITILDNMLSLLKDEPALSPDSKNQEAPSVLQQINQLIELKKQIVKKVG